METKNIIVTLMLVLVASLTMIAAADFSVSPTTVTLTKSTDSTTFKITNTNAVNSTTITIPQFADVTDSDGNIVDILTDLTSVTLAAGAEQTVTVSYSTFPEGLNPGVYTTTSTITDGTDTITVTLDLVNDFCQFGELNKSGITLEIDISNDGEGEDDEWLPRDEIEVEVEITNDNEFDLDDIQIELALFERSSGKNIADDLIWISKGDEEVDIGDVDEDEDEEHIFRFKVASDMGVDDNNYILMVKAFPDNDEDEICIDSTSDFTRTYYTNINIDREDEDDRQIIFENIEITDDQPIPAGMEVTVKTKVYNIGEEDQDKVKVKLFNSALGVDLFHVIDDFETDDSAKTIEFTFIIPEDAEGKLHTLGLIALYDYDDDEDEAEDLAYDEESEQTSVHLRVQEEPTEVPGGTITASATKLSDETPNAVTGKSVTVETQIENTGTADATYTISVSGVSSWATVDSISPETFTLAPGETQDVSVTLDIDKSAEAGDREFTLTADYGVGTAEQKVLLDVEKGFSIGNFSGGLSDNWFIYTVIVIDIILILAIIIAVRRMVSRRA